MRDICVITEYKALTYDNGKMLSYHRGKLYQECGKVREYICDIPLSRSKKWLCKIRIFERMLRIEPRVACNLGEDQYLLSCSGEIYHIDADKKLIETELHLRQGMNNPLAFTKSISEDGNIQAVLFGEYFSNNGFEKVSIYERKDSKWEEIYSFPPNRIYHIHGIIPGIDKDTFYVFTGDSDQESAIWLTTDHFRTLDYLVGGSQQYRSCVAFPYRDGILYATDTPRETNYLYYLHEIEGCWETEKIYEMPGPCIYGTRRNECLLFATSVEADDTLPAWRYRISRKLGSGVKDRYSHLLSVDKDGNIEEITRLKKDALPMLIFQFGNCLFPDANNEQPIVFTPISVKRFDGKTLLVKV